jgi:hypothetical protein
MYLYFPDTSRTKEGFFHKIYVLVLLRSSASTDKYSNLEKYSAPIFRLQTILTALILRIEHCIECLQSLLYHIADCYSGEGFIYLFVVYLLVTMSSVVRHTAVCFDPE